MTGEVAGQTLEIPLDRRPRHIAIIMDGNGRWAERQNLPRIAGHQRGVDSVRRTTEECARLKIEQLTLYCLSSENWKRPQTEINFLMHLLEQYMIEERATIMENNVRVRMLGRRDRDPRPGAARARSYRRNERLKHGPLVEPGDQLRRQSGDRGCCASDRPLHPSRQFVSRRYRRTNNHRESLHGRRADPDLLIRTAGEMRISNFLLWQISYAEIWVTEKCWPEFDEPTLHDAIRGYAARRRRFGGLGG